MKFNRSIQGSKNASSVFTRAMEVTFQGLDHMVSYWVDDLIAYSRDDDSHIRDLELVFERIRACNMMLSPGKAKFLCGEVEYLGMVIEGESFSIADKKLEAIDNLIAPKDYVQLRSQLALFQYYKKFIPFFSEIVLPLQRLMKKGVEYVWTEECTAAYILMKEMFKEKLSLYIPNPPLPYVVHTDASNFASSSVLHQRVDGALVPIAFHSEAFTGSQLGQHILEKEMYALVEAVKRFEYYLVGTNFEVSIDSRVLLYLWKAKESNPKLYRWSLVLHGHSFTITHVSSARNLVADMLSQTTNDKGQEKARQLSMTKKDLLDRYKRETEQCFLPHRLPLHSTYDYPLQQENTKEALFLTLAHRNL